MSVAFVNSSSKPVAIVVGAQQPRATQTGTYVFAFLEAGVTTGVLQLTDSLTLLGVADATALQIEQKTPDAGKAWQRQWSAFTKAGGDTTAKDVDVIYQSNTVFVAPKGGNPPPSEASAGIANITQNLVVLAQGMVGSSAIDAAVLTPQGAIALQGLSSDATDVTLNLAWGASGFRVTAQDLTNLAANGALSLCSYNSNGAINAVSLVKTVDASKNVVYTFVDCQASDDVDKNAAAQASWVQYSKGKTTPEWLEVLITTLAVLFLITTCIFLGLYVHRVRSRK